MSSDLALFRRRLLQNPRQVSAIAPSSKTLARAMTLGLGPQSGRVVEFGPGTGRFTEAALARGLPPENLTLFELDAEFVDHLRRRFPGVTVHQAPAQQAAALLDPGVQVVLSGLPLLSMHPHRDRQLWPAGGSRRQVLGRADPALDHQLPDRLGKAARRDHPRAWRDQAGGGAGQHGHRRSARRSARPWCRPRPRCRGQVRRQLPAGGLADRLGHPVEHERQRGDQQPRHRDHGRRDGLEKAGPPERPCEHGPVVERHLPDRDACRHRHAWRATC
jgi:hypothetical protein